MTTEIETVEQRPGHDALWLWFGLSRANFLTLPRVLMHAMPDEWQGKMAALLDEWEDAWKNHPDINVHVVGRRDGKYCDIPEWLRNYRYPDKNKIEWMRGSRQ